jgi:CRISPR-associated protein Csm1
MTDEKLNLIVLAGLLHDVGKLFERGEIFKEARHDEEYLNLCPEARKGGYSTHLHAVHTAAFCDWLEDRFDCLRNTTDKNWKAWCAAHHRNDEKDDEASVIRISDRLSSSERDEGDYYQKDIHRKTLLEPVLERVSLAGYPDCLATAYRYPLARLTSEKNSLFPVKGAECRIGDTPLNLREMEGPEGVISDKDQWCHLVAEKSQPVIEAYRKLGKGFQSEIQALSDQCPDISLPDLVTCLTTLLERYTANVPSATNLRHPDISLFDHLRTTAAIAQALYLQFKHERHFRVDMDQDDPEFRWLLVCGDFSGIQKFIYKLTNKGAAKGLRGRSFYVSHFCRICADYILREMGLTKASLLYNSGGKFFLLIPSHMKQRLYDVRAEVNEWLLDEFGGDVFFGLGLADVNAKMFVRGNMDKAWETAALDLEYDRLRKFREQINGPGFFEPQTKNDPSRHCRICGSNRKLKEIQQDGETILECESCKNMERLGSIISDTGAIITLWGSQADADLIIDRLGLDNRVLKFTKWNIYCLMLPNTCIEKIKGIKFKGEFTFLNEDRPFEELLLPKCGITSLYIGKWARDRCVHKNGEPWDFEDYAKKSEGIERLGILRMDVDNLGMVFIKGLDFPKRENNGWGKVIIENGKRKNNPMASISRMVTLSRQLNHFFSGHLPELLENDARFDKCQIIYAGGDDLFIIGSWDQLPELAETIRSEFKAFCCMNPVFSISGGLILQGGKYPIYKGSLLAGSSEKKAKELRASWGRSKNRIEKDGFCFLGVPTLWEDFDIAKEMREMLKKDMDKNRGLLSFLSQMTGGNTAFVQSIRRKEGLTVPNAWEKIAFSSWRWRTAYQLRRRYGKDWKQIEKWSNLLFGNQLDNRTSTLPVYSWLEMPLRWAEFLNRKQGGDK